MSFLWLYIIIGIAGSAGFLLGACLNYQRGRDDGWQEGYSEAADDAAVGNMVQDIRWECTSKAETP